MAQQQEQTLIPNDVYDVIKAVAEKLEGLAAYKKYESDGNRDLWQKLKQADEQSVKSLIGQLEKFAKDGKLAIH